MRKINFNSKRLNLLYSPYRCKYTTIIQLAFSINITDYINLFTKGKEKLEGTLSFEMMNV